VTSALTNDGSALTLLNQLHQEIMHTQDANVLSTSLAQYTAIAAARAARRHPASPLPSAVSSPYEQMVRPQSLASEQLRLQIAMDRMSKMMSTLSNILKKASDTAQAITQNLK